MSVKSTLQEIITINKVIVENKLDKLKPRSEEMNIAYNSMVKPLLDKFKESHSFSTNNYIKNILAKCDSKNISGIKLKGFQNYGQKINPYVWTTFYINNENKRPASYSIQLYILVDHLGLKFGFDYGDKVRNDDTIVKFVPSDSETQSIILNAITNNDLDILNLKAGSPVIEYEKKEKDLIKTNKDFNKWNSNIHIIKSYKADEIHENLEEEIIKLINSLLPIYNRVKLDVVETENKGYWIYAPGEQAKDWNNQFENGFMSIDYDYPDDLKEIKTKEELDDLVDEYDLGSYNTSMALWQFSNEINIGDVIISKQGRTKCVGFGIVTSEYIFDESKSEYKHTRKVNWKKSGNWKSADNLPMKTLTNITSYRDFVERLKKLIGIEGAQIPTNEIEFNLENLLKNVFIKTNDFENIIEILKIKKNIILQGSAGVGKTYIAKKIAQGLQENYNEDTIEVIQFHQSYSYEDFIQGYRPNKDSFELKNGVFYQLCERAKKNITTPYFIVIDEINRGNLSKIFGELMMLIEADKRGEKNKIKLTYSSDDDYFYVPDNIHIIGTMNTADRSLTIVDYALRRRFAFIKMIPKFNNQFEEFILSNGLSEGIIKKIVSKMNYLNQIIRDDESLGDGFEIGHSYFCTFSSGNEKRWYNNVIEFEIIPLIKEYWFDDPDKVSQYSEELLS